MRPRNFFTLDLKKVPWKWIAALLLAVFLLYAAGYVYDEITQLPPAEVVKQGLTKTVNAQSYRYHAVAIRYLEGKESVISELSGEKNLKGVHLKGHLPIIQAEVEVYHMGDVLYRRDTMTDGWVVVPDKGRLAVEQLIAEINPLGAFHFSEQDTFDVKYVGKESINKNTCRVYEVLGRGVNKFMELYWQDFRYRLWIDKRDGYILKAQVMAEHRDDSQHILNINMELGGFDEPIEIIPPQIGS